MIPTKEEILETYRLEMAEILDGNGRYCHHGRRNTKGSICGNCVKELTDATIQNLTMLIDSQQMQIDALHVHLDRKQ